MNTEPKYNRGHKMYIDKAETKESAANIYFDCRDGIINSVEYTDMSGYGSHTRLLFCQNTKHETVAIIRQTYNQLSKEYIEEILDFDSDSFKFLKALINGQTELLGGKFELLRNY